MAGKDVDWDEVLEGYRSTVDWPGCAYWRELMETYPQAKVILTVRDRSVIVPRLRAAGCVFAEDEAQLLISAARMPADLAAMVDRRAGGLPLEHVLGWAQFCGLRIAVDPGVFVPRRRTELLVRHAARPRPATSCRR